jgi:hypothetical protein
MSTTIGTRESSPSAAPASTRDGPHRRPHGQSWTLRALLAALVLGQLLTGNREGATVASMGLAITLIPPLISRFSGWHVPRQLELTFVAAMVLQYGSESLKLFERFTYWDKLVHPAEIFLATAVVTFLFLGFRHVHQLDIPDGLCAAGAMLFGMTLGTSWELVEFALDWFGNANLQKSNADTLTDVLTNDAGAIFGTLAAFWLYRHRTTVRQRAECGRIADWLTGRLVWLFGEHGSAVGVGVALVVGAIILAGWLVDRAPPPPAAAARGTPETWRFAVPAAPTAPTAVLLGDWREDVRGICRVNPEPPQPGSEKLGLLALSPGASYGADAAFAAAARYTVERPSLGAGTAMETGLAFGVRGPDDFYVLRASAAHDLLVLERYRHGRVRDLREERVRTRGDESHELRVEVQGDRVTALLDGAPWFEERGLADTAGGLALWARVTATACFSEARVAPL